MKHIKLLSLTSLLPVAIVPTITTSCNKNTIDENHLLTLWVVESDGLYLPESCHSEEPKYIKYSKGTHTFVVKEIQNNYPVPFFWLSDNNPTEKWIMDDKNWKVTHDGVDITDQWEIHPTNPNYIRPINGEEIYNGSISFTVTTLEDCEFIPLCNAL